MPRLATAALLLSLASVAAEEEGFGRIGWLPSLPPLSALLRR